MWGAGNDFIVIDNRSRQLQGDIPAFVRAVCQRRAAVGADGVIFLEPSTKVHFKMMYYNADGSYGAMCGNGGRCIAQFAFNQKIAPSKLTFEALDHMYEAEVNGQTVFLKMKDPIAEQLNFPLDVDGQTFNANSIDTGAPHVVIFLDEFAKQGFDIQESFDVIKTGKAIRYHHAFSPEGTNVNFVTFCNDKSLRIRTYERGVETETLACGTGSVASALIASRIKRLSSPIIVHVRSGEDLKIHFNKRGDKFVDVRLEGNANVVYHGELRYDPIKRCLVE